MAGKTKVDSTRVVTTALEIVTTNGPNSTCDYRDMDRRSASRTRECFHGESWSMLPQPRAACMIECCEPCFREQQGAQFPKLLCPSIRKGANKNDFAGDTDQFHIMRRLQWALGCLSFKNMPSVERRASIVLDRTGGILGGL